MFPQKTKIFHGEFNFLGPIANKAIQFLGPSKPNCPVKKWLGINSISPLLLLFPAQWLPQCKYGIDSSLYISAKIFGTLHH